MKLLATQIPEIETAKDLNLLIQAEENVMVCCGRMGPMCIPVYDIMSSIESEYDHVAFRSMAFDSPEAAIIRNLPECKGFMGLPFTVYYKDGKVAHATTSIQNKGMVTNVLDSKFSK